MCTNFYSSTLQATKDRESSAFELAGMKSKLDAEKKNSAFQVETLKKTVKQLEEELESTNQEKGIQSRWITDQKQTLEKEVADLEEEREALLKDLDDLEAKVAAKTAEAEELSKQINGLQDFR